MLFCREIDLVSDCPLYAYDQITCSRVLSLQMYGLYKDPKGRNIFVVPSPSHYNSGTAKSQIGSNLGNTNCVDHSTKDVTVIALYKKIEALESALVEQNSSAVCYTMLIMIS